MFYLLKSFANATISQISFNNLFDTVIEIVLNLKLIQFTVDLAAEIMKDTLINTLRSSWTYWNCMIGHLIDEFTSLLYRSDKRKFLILAGWALGNECLVEYTGQRIMQGLVVYSFPGAITASYSISMSLWSWLDVTWITYCFETFRNLARWFNDERTFDCIEIALGWHLGLLHA